MSPLIAIDGPAGSGKSSVSAAIARTLGIDRLDTGAMYRAVAWLALRAGIDPGAAGEVTALAALADISVGQRVTADGHDVTDAIRSPAVGEAVSLVAAVPGVRQALVARQRAWASDRGGDVVVEGRDIGTVVFPDADLKVFLTASVEERVRRREEEGATALERRDRLDSTRTVAPLSAAPDARVVDTTHRTVAEVVEVILSWL